MALGISRQPGETWREAVQRVSAQHNLANECLGIFDVEVAAGAAESIAAWGALYEWDCLEFVPDSAPPAQ